MGFPLRSGHDPGTATLAAATLGFVLLLLGLPAASAAAQEPASAAHSRRTTEVTFHSSSNLVLVDVTALYANSGLPDGTLKRDDFEIFDDGRPVSIKTFDTGAQARPLAIWFLAR
jgi:hypothetical protein